MREIKFRVYIKNMEGFNAPYFEKIGRIFDVCEIDFESKEVSFRTPSLEYLPFKDCVLLQYIGRKDDNDVEIYEGDIIKGHQDFNDFLGVITYNPKMCNFVVESFITKMRSTLDIHWMKVIGNLYENPELLKSKYNEV